MSLLDDVASPMVDVALLDNLLKLLCANLINLRSILLVGPTLALWSRSAQVQ